jgi:hypothetical protein
LLVCLYVRLWPEYVIAFSKLWWTIYILVYTGNDYCILSTSNMIQRFCFKWWFLLIVYLPRYNGDYCWFTHSLVIRLINAWSTEYDVIHHCVQNVQKQITINTNFEWETNKSEHKSIYFKYMTNSLVGTYDIWIYKISE